MDVSSYGSQNVRLDASTRADCYCSDSPSSMSRVYVDVCSRSITRAVAESLAAPILIFCIISFLKPLQADLVKRRVMR